MRQTAQTASQKTIPSQRRSKANPDLRLAFNRQPTSISRAWSDQNSAHSRHKPKRKRRSTYRALTRMTWSWNCQIVFHMSSHLPPRQEFLSFASGRAVKMHASAGLSPTSGRECGWTTTSQLCVNLRPLQFLDLRRSFRGSVRSSHGRTRRSSRCAILQPNSTRGLPLKETQVCSMEALFKPD